MSESARTQVFVSYSHHDAQWLERFERKLKPAIKEEAFSIWSDQAIQAGENWKPVIEDKLESATVALLLVSDEFLASEFIQDVELPAILDAAKSRGLRILWVPLTFTTVQWSALVNYQACWPVEQPLDSLTAPEQDRAIRDICYEICRQCGQLARTTLTQRDLLRQNLKDAIPEKLGIAIDEAIDGGDYSVVYRGTQGEHAVAIKVLVDSPFRERADSFESAARVAADLAHPCFIKVRHTVLDREPHCLIMDYLKAPVLQRVLSDNGAFRTDVVAVLIAELADALSEYHATGLIYGSIYASDVFVENAQRLRLSTAGVSSFLSRNEGLMGCFPRSRQAATYATPEHYFGHSLSQKSDQYSLGLLAFEMLEGKPPVAIGCLADFETKREFFRDPGAFAGQWQQHHPALASIVFRMLAENPDQRWPSLSELARELRNIESEAVAVAKRSYRTHCEGRTTFFADFYRRYFERCPEVQRWFGDLKAQYAKLDHAVQFLLNFQPNAQEPTNLSATAAKHKAFRLTERQFDQFRCALLETLRAATGQDEYVARAWQVTIEPGLEYLKRSCVPDAPRPVETALEAKADRELELALD
jgi:hemoglobin-like flavoprotein